jgi:prepilin peptidase CpaA
MLSYSYDPRIVFLVALLSIAAVYDLRFQRIPNWLTFPAMAVSVAGHTTLSGLAGFTFSFSGIALGMAVLIVFYLTGGMGAGDVKLMGAVGGVLGAKGVFAAFFCTAAVGGIYAIGLMAASGILRKKMKSYWTTFTTLLITKQVVWLSADKTDASPKLCYGVAIAVGTLLSLAVGSSVLG